MAETDAAGGARAKSRTARKARRKTRNRKRLGIAGAVLVVGGAATAFAVGFSGSSDAQKDARLASPAGAGGVTGGPGFGKGPKPNWDGKVEVLGDGSTSYTGPQPGQLKPEKLKPGEKPPQFVVFSWDGALEGDDHLFSHFRQVAKQNKAHMTFFLTGIYLLPDAKKNLYRPPQHGQGAAAISYPTAPHVKDTIRQLRGAWTDGNEIGSHFNGHFCGPKGGGDWSPEEWKSEIDQAYGFMKAWKTNTGFSAEAPLPFDPDREVVGGRAPCLEGQKNLITAIKPYGWRYDASSSGDFQLWPSKIDGIWNFPLQLVPLQGKEVQVLSMDFNFLYNQSGDSTQGDPSKFPAWRDQVRGSYMNGFNRVYNGSRAPMFIGNHFEDWNGGIYMKAVEDVMKDVCNRQDVRCASFREVADWMDAQDPKVLAQLRMLDPAQAPDWKAIVK
ncbi:MULTISPECIES: hypothetical protein [Streptomyces]|uniref:hypothetical protein n=1 Tax=Streptomyces TaxID=1883 RepID=UPI000F7A68FB|nr:MULTISPECIES: hypothetical protein [Streptomyces]RST07757.1 hypothetical protein EF910_04735 [Streptomyces sp. WAC07149]GLX17333.1 hypothetical protein Slala01_09770 [Streptomyces lavendulae subsp. lavendulae]GLX24808.1 hypothetical protein Slala02_06280 [Streptomyces lavendulae subsp. lavendulae]